MTRLLNVAVLAALFAGGFLLSRVALAAGESLIGNGCLVYVPVDAGYATSGDDGGCKWIGGSNLKLQCSDDVRYTRGGMAPTAFAPKVVTGDPYPITAIADSTVIPLKIMQASFDAGSVTCNIYIDNTAKK